MEHAILSASSASRWLKCPGSVKLTKDMPETTSEYAEAGRLAHSIAELKLRKRFLAGLGAQKYKKEMATLTGAPHYDPEMQHTTDDYADFVEQLYLSYPEKPYLAVEQKVDFSTFVPDGFGTSDCIMIGNRTMDVIDYKHGKGVPVVAEENPQMKLYGLGALMRYRAFYTIDTIRLHIFQPRIGEPQSWEISRDDLINWGALTVKPAAKEAFEGSDICTPGDWCRFCKAKALCRARSDVYTALEDFGYSTPALLSNSEVGGILEIGTRLKKWVSDLEEYCLGALLRGEDIPGWKVVAGRSVRSFDDADAAFKDIMAAGVEEALLYERKPLTLAQIEKILGKKEFAEAAGGHIVTPPGKPTLAPAGDNRPAYNTAYNTAEEDFK